MSPRPDVSKERTEQILKAAENVFARKGIDRARMDDVAEETELSKATLYLYFKSKDSLLVALLERMFAGAFDRLEKRAATASSAAESIVQFTDDAARGYASMLRVLPMVFELLALAIRNRAFQKAAKQYLAAYMRCLVPIVQKGIESGEFRRVEAKEVAIAAAAILEGTVLLWAYDRNLVSIQRHIRSGIRLLLDGILAPR
jgi:AcrR family transcriptional regulator